MAAKTPVVITLANVILALREDRVPEAVVVIAAAAPVASNSSLRFFLKALIMELVEMPI